MNLVLIEDCPQVANSMGFPGGVSGKEYTCQCRRHKSYGFHPWVGEFPWRRAQQSTSSILAWRITHAANSMIYQTYILVSSSKHRKNSPCPHRERQMDLQIPM